MNPLPYEPQLQYGALGLLAFVLVGAFILAMLVARAHIKALSKVTESVDAIALRLAEVHVLVKEAPHRRRRRRSPAKARSSKARQRA